MHQRWYTYEAEAVDYQGGDSVCERPNAENVKVQTGYNQIPKEVASGQCLDETGSASIAPYALLPVHVLAFVVDEHNPDGHAVDQGTLHKGHDMGVPIQALPARKLRVVLRREQVREERRYRVEDDRVEERGGQNLVDVQRKRREDEEVGHRLDGRGQPGNRREEEGVLHRERRMRVSEDQRG